MNVENIEVTIGHRCALRVMSITTRIRDSCVHVTTCSRSLDAIAWYSFDLGPVAFDVLLLACLKGVVHIVMFAPDTRESPPSPARL
jgi:hypothetical protein